MHSECTAWYYKLYCGVGGCGGGAGFRQMGGEVPERWDVRGGQVAELNHDEVGGRNKEAFRVQRRQAAWAGMATHAAWPFFSGRS